LRSNDNMSQSSSPTPDAAAATTNPPHFKVGLGFVKAYYKALTEHPEALVNFYKAGTSFLGHGEGSTVADPKPLEEYDLSVNRWGCSSNETMRFDFEHGAIDTQPVNGGVLLVVTAQVFFDKHGTSTKASECKDFVQTFFLAREGRNFACYNDVLRFLQFPEGKSPGAKSSAAAAATITATAATNTHSTVTTDVGVETMPEEETKVLVEEIPLPAALTATDMAEISTETTPALTDEAPGGGVEETKEEAPEEDEEEPAPAVAPPPSKDGKGKRGKGGKSQQEKQQPAAKPAPGSWASLVAAGGSAPNTPSRKAAEKPADTVTETVVPEAEKTKAKAPTVEATKPAQEVAPATGATANGAAAKSSKAQPFQRPKRDADNTLVIKNLSDNIKEQDLINMFKPFATSTDAKMVGTNLNHHRGLAFVDFDQVAPVMAVLQKHKDTPFQWNGKVLEVEQKSQEVKTRRKDNNGYRGGGGGGRDSYRRGDRARGGRGGRGGGGRGGGAGR
jgi:hypothetical protein